MTDRAAEQPTGGGALRRRSLWALVVVLPLAFAAHGRDSAREWWRASDLYEQRVPPGQAAPLSGAEWRVVNLQRVAERRDGSAVALLELEAKVSDPAKFAQLPCRLALADAAGRRWAPTFVSPTEVMRSPAGRAGPTMSCGGAVTSNPAPGAALRIGASFILPRAAFDAADVVLSLPGDRPRFLRFQRKA